MSEGKDEFAPYGAVPLNVIAGFGKYLYVRVPDLPDWHTWQIAHALESFTAASLTKAQRTGLPLHDGVIALQQGRPVPEYATTGHEHK